MRHRSIRSSTQRLSVLDCAFWSVRGWPAGAGNRYEPGIRGCSQPESDRAVKRAGNSWEDHENESKDDPIGHAKTLRA
jgi:hypothetical protein